MTKKELKAFLKCDDKLLNSIQKYVKDFFGDYYNYLVKDTISNHDINCNTFEEIFYIFSKMNLQGLSNSPDVFFKNIGHLSDRGLNSHQIAEQIIGLWAFNILDNRPVEHEFLTLL